jgi:hypothetical protein
MVAVLGQRLHHALRRRLRDLIRALHAEVALQKEAAE